MTRSATITIEPARLSGEAAPRQRFYRPELDVLRFVAFLCVFTIHVLGVSPGAIRGQRVLAPIGAYGMCLFFFLSAYLITELLRREQGETGSIHIGAFYARRVLRIWPLYFGFLLFGKLLGILYPTFHLENARLLAFLLLLGNWYLSLYGVNASPVGPLWSISLEEQFYLIWPALARFGGMRMLFWCSAALLPVAWCALALGHGYQPAVMGLEFDGTIWCNTFVQFQFFGIGAMTALLLRGRLPALRTATRVSAFVLGFAVWLAASALFRLPRFGHRLPGPVLIAGYTLIGVGCLLLFASLLGIAPGSLPKSLIHLGKVSYGLYVFHVLFIEIMYLLLRRAAGRFGFGHGRFVWFILIYGLALVPTIVAARVSYRFFETPFLRLKKRFTLIPSRAV